MAEHGNYYSDGNFDVKFYKNNVILKNINTPISLDTKKWQEYIGNLKAIQKTVNEFLTEVVDQEQEQSNEEDINNVQEEEDDEEEESEAESPKRKFVQFDRHKNKKVKI